MVFLRGEAAGPCFRRVWLYAFGAVMVGFVVAAAGAYRFYPDHDTVAAPVAADAMRWDPAVWGPGQTLEFFLAVDDPGWDAAGVSPEQARGPIERALSRWATVPGADIRWRIGGVVSTGGPVRDGENTVTVNEHPAVGFSFVHWWVEGNAESGERLVECDLVLDQHRAADLSGADAQAIVAHEFGHCLGLDHTWASNTWSAWLRDGPDLWGGAPIMSYGERDTALLPDDMTGARLLRPDLAGTRNDDGSIAGEVTVRGDPAAYVYVVASPTFGSERQGVGAFTDDRGRFEIEGLRPGGYRLRAGSIRIPSAHREFVISDGTVDTGDVLTLGQIEVRTGEVTGLVRLELPVRPER